MNWHPVTERAHDPNAQPIDAIDFELTPRERDTAAFGMQIVRERIRRQNERDKQRGMK